MIDHNVTTIARALGGERRRRASKAASGAGAVMDTLFWPVAPTDARRRPAAPASPLEVHDLTVAYHRKPVLWRRRLHRPAEADRHRRPQRRRQEHAVKAVPRAGARGLRLGAVFGSPLRQAPLAGRLRAAARERGLGLPGHRARRGRDGPLRQHRLVPAGRPAAPRGGAGLPGAGRHGAIRRPADQPALRRPAAARLPGPRPGPGGRALFHGRAVRRRRRRHRAGHRRCPARA